MELMRKTAREDWVAAGLEILVADGWSHLGIVAAADQLGVSRLCFYDHFEDRQDWLSALLAYWEYRAFATLTLAGLQATDRVNLLAVTRAVIDWSRFDDRAAAALLRLREEEAKLLRHQLQDVA